MKKPPSTLTLLLAGLTSISAFAACPNLAGTWKNTSCSVVRDTGHQTPVGLAQQLLGKPFTIAQRKCSDVNLGGGNNRIGMFKTVSESKVSENPSVGDGSYTKTSLMVFEGDSLVETTAQLNYLNKRVFQNLTKTTYKVSGDTLTYTLEQTTAVDDSGLTKIECTAVRQ